MKWKNYTILLIIGLTLVITYLNYSTGSSVRTLHNIYREIYYVPVLLGALSFGLRGSLLAYAFVFILYLPYVAMTWPGPVLSETNRLLPLLLQGLFACIAGYLVDRDRRQRAQLIRERSLADIGRTATVIVHDLKNPLIAIQGFAERIREGKGKAETAAQVILNSTERMEKIISSVLDFARPLQLEFQTIDLRDVVQNAEGSCRIKAAQKKLVLSVELPDAPARIEADGPLLERAFINLLTNAIEASKEGQAVSISVASRKHFLSIVIADNGPGMDRETLENIFAPFYSKKRGGTGLGAAIAKKVIEGHRGEILVKSRPGQGTEITVELPVRSGAA